MSVVVICDVLILTITLDKHFVCHNCRHRQDSAPLLGEGELSLQDPEAPAQDALASPSTTDYGATKDEPPVSAAGGGGKGKTSKTIEVPKGFGGGGDDASAVTHESQTVISKLALASKPHVPPQNPCLWLFHLLQGLATLTSLLLLVSQLLPLVLPGSKVTHPDILSSILKVYVSLICFAFMIVEAELPVPFVRDSTLLNAFWSRGFIYSFIGLVCTTEAYSERVDDLITHSSQRFYIGWVAIFMQVVSWMMFGIGGAYMLLGITCMRGLRDNMKQKEKDMWKQYRDEMRVWKERHK